MSAINQNAVEFIERWKDKGDEKQHSQRFWIDLLESIFEVKNASQIVQFEETVKKENSTNFIDIFIPKTKVIIEQKGKHVDLRKKIKQSDKQELTPFEQARRYNVSLPHSQKARWIVTCNFQTFLIYDMENDPNGLNPLELKLEDLGTKYNELKFLVEYQDQRIIEEQELSIKAGELIGKIYELLKPQYKDPENPNSAKSLNKLCVRLVFCLYAEDAGLFDRHDNHIFGNYLKKTETKHLRKALIDLFTVLNQDPDKNERDPYLEDDLARFPYVNGNLFKIESPETDEIPNFTDEIKKILIEECSESFDWADISPTIFGALFESTMNPDTRRSGGMHYTSIENIHKVIDPLFLDELKAEFDRIKEFKRDRKIDQECFNFQQKLASLKFLDPACGSGNFLTETYLCLRRLENELILFQSKNQNFLPFENPVKVSIKQFYGIEINDFAVAVANTALWIAESQMLHETENIIHREIEFLPLKTNSNIHQGNALRLDWNEICPKTELNFIMGNPPFVANSGRTKAEDSHSKGMQSEQQKEDRINLFGMNGGNLDYVACWFKKASLFIINTPIKVAFVSTRSICRGQQVEPLWKPIFEDGISLNFSYDAFKWGSEVKNSGTVYVTIIGFSYVKEKNKRIFHNNYFEYVNNINAYLMDAENIFVTSRANPICNVPKMHKGSQPTDNGNFFLTQEEKDLLLLKEPFLKEIIRPFLGGEEFLKNKKRYCLWLKDADLSVFRKSTAIAYRLEKIAEFRLKSSKIATRKSAETPYLFQEIRQPTSNYLVVPEITSGDRKYIPMGFLSPEIICSNKLQLLPNATLYEFGVLQSSIHMAWVKAVCGMYGPSYDYSNKVVYNNFIWPEVTEEQKEKIYLTAQEILDVRSIHSASSLADLYDPFFMPQDLRKAHKSNDKAVLALYGFKPDATEEEIIAKLMQMYAEKVKGE